MDPITKFLQENLIFSDKTLLIDKSKFDISGVLLIVGASAAGKSTLSKKISEKTGAEYIDLDKIWPGVDKQYRIEHNVDLNTKLESLDSSIQNDLISWSRKKLLGICTKLKHDSNKDKKIIIDGMDLLLDPFTPEWSCDCAMVVMRPSMLKTLFRRFKRNPKNLILNFPRFFKYTLSKQRFEFDGLLDNYIKKRIKCSKEVETIGEDGWTQ